MSRSPLRRSIDGVRERQSWDNLSRVESAAGPSTRAGRVIKVEVTTIYSQAIVRSGMDDVDRYLFGQGCNNVARVGNAITAEVSAGMPAATQMKAERRKFRDDCLVVGEAARAAPRP
jgi:hypothetical protein